MEDDVVAAVAPGPGVATDVAEEGEVVAVGIAGALGCGDAEFVAGTGPALLQVEGVFEAHDGGGGDVAGVAEASGEHCVNTLLLRGQERGEGSPSRWLGV